MQNVNIVLEQAWVNLDDAIDYFLAIILDLKALKRLPEPPTDLFLNVQTGKEELSDKQRDDLQIILTSL